ncbi:phage portal protein [Rhizobium sp. IMFF44]|uniref:phage portal protein n=1 Tax=Rhizobium sp. IMFF44 TaxID=3342350 RepID=UPI0035B71E4E
MSIRNSIMSFFGLEKREAIPVSDPQIARIFGIGSSAETASKLSTAARCISLLASTYASYDAVLYKLQKDGSPTPAVDHPLYGILMDGTPDMSSQEIRTRLMSDFVRHGNAYAHVEFDQNGKITNLKPLAFRDTVVEALGNGRLLYRHSDPLRNNVQTVYSQDSIFHAKWMPLGFMGRSPIELAALSMGIAVGVEEATKADAERGFKASGILTAPGAIGDDTAKRLKEMFESQYLGPDAAGKIAVVGDGLTFEKFSLSNRDAELIENRKFNAYLVAQAYGVPADVAGLPFHSTWSSATEANRQFVNLAATPWSRALNDQLAAFVLTSRERKAMWIANDFSALIAGSLQERAAAYGSLVVNRIMTTNEARTAFDLPHKEGGDDLVTPLNVAAIPHDPAKNGQQKGVAA